MEPLEILLADTSDLEPSPLDVACKNRGTFAVGSGHARNDILTRLPGLNRHYCIGGIYPLLGLRLCIPTRSDLRPRFDYQCRIDLGFSLSTF